MRRFSILWIILVFTSLATALRAQPAQLDLEAIAAVPGTEIRKERSSTGEEIVTIRRGGVEITIEGGRSLGIDRSGHGAVLCLWQIYAHLKVVLDTCFPGEHQELRDELNAATDKINDFIVANSLTPVKKSDLEAQLTAMGDAYQSPRSTLPRKCAGERLRGMIRGFIDTPADKRKAALAELLSVPRPPVLNPCL